MRRFSNEFQSSFAVRRWSSRQWVTYSISIILRCGLTTNVWTQSRSQICPIKFSLFWSTLCTVSWSLSFSLWRQHTECSTANFVHFVNPPYPLSIFEFSTNVEKTILLLSTLRGHQLYSLYWQETTSCISVCSII